MWKFGETVVKEKASVCAKQTHVLASICAKLACRGCYVCSIVLFDLHAEPTPCSEGM